MDQWVKNKLAEWDLGKWQGVFEEEEVDQCAFECLTEEAIKKMLPKAGPQSKFLTRWKSEFLTTEIESASLLFASSTNCNVNHEPILNPPFTPVSEICGVSDNAALMGINVLSPLHQISESFSIEHNPDWLIDSTDISILPSAPITDLIYTLRNTAQGVAILRFYKDCKDLTEEHRCYLVEIILYEELKNSENLALTPERLLQLSCLIKKTFPTEDVYTYYVPYRVDSVTKKKVCAKGKLYDRYNTHRSFLLFSKATNSLRGKKRKYLDSPTPVRLAFRKHFTTDACSTDDYQEKINWLKNSIDPWSTVEKYWADTSLQRIKKLYETKELSIESYIDTYPALKDPARGIKLIELDFATLYPDKVNALFTEFRSLESEIVKFCKTKKKRFDGETKNLLVQIEQNSKDHEIDARQPLASKSCAAVLRLLPLLLPPPAGSKTVGQARRPSKSEVQDEFLLHVQTIEELDSKLSTRREKHLATGRPEQSLAVIVGPSLDNIEYCYVCISGIKYVVTSVLKAIDISFKSFYALQLQYPSHALLPWMVIQHRIYDIKGEADTVVPCVSKFVAELQKLALK